jgi:hypothetical protein
MSGFWDLNLIHLFAFYLAVAFLISTYLRIGQYRSILALVGAVPGRWPRLFQLVKQHGMIFLTWSTVLPGMLALVLLALHTVACQWIWPQASLTPALLGQHWPALVMVATLAAAMLGIDWYLTFNFGKVDRGLMQKYFDQAEYWLRSWTAPVVRVFTLGYINPRKMVAVEVQKALIQVSRLINSTFWWVSLQVGVRIAFGLSLWLAYARSGS